MPAPPVSALSGERNARSRVEGERRHADRRRSWRRERLQGFDPGGEPPLSTEAGRAPDRRQVSVRWLAGTVLAGIFGAALMAGAVMATLDGPYSFEHASLAVSADALGRTGDGRSNGPRKADKLLARSDTITAHQIIRLSTTSRIGDRDVIKVKPFTRVIANLALQPGPLADEVPAFDVARLTSDGSTPTLAELGPAPDDGDVSVKTMDLAGVAVGTEDGLSPALDQLRAMGRQQLDVEAGRDALGNAQASVPLQLLTVGLAAGSSAPAASLAYAVRELDASAALDVRIVPENLTEIGKAPADGQALPEERTIVVQDGDTLASILKGLGGTPEQTAGISHALEDAATLVAGQRLKVLTVPGQTGRETREPVRVSIYTADTHIATAALSDAGDYVAIQDPDAPTGAAQSEADEDADDESSGRRLYDSIYETALQQAVPKPVIEALLRVYAYDIDLTRRARPGDTFELFYDSGSDASTGEILYTALSIDGELKRYYRFEGEDGVADYYDEEGISARKFLTRKPITGGRMSSPFGFRIHPILGYAKLHTGVDWADKIGTPISATGNGTVAMAGMKSGYGRHVEIQHPNGYVSTYSHMSGFARGIEVGAKVRMGQVIGFIGTSGLSTGAHVHYEVKINGNFVDPMRIKLPQGRELDGATLATFRKERERIDGMMNKAPTANAAEDTVKKG